ncbi:MAG: transglutaminase family protein [Burkholderiaceae bacterium]
MACLRLLGLPARYMSGYILTHPAPGQPKLVGADESHAWLSVWDPTLGWIDFDPTNDMIPDDEHVVVAWGRDYSDVSPINGFIVGGGSHELAVSVDVQPTDAIA